MRLSLERVLGANLLIRDVPEATETLPLPRISLVGGRGDRILCRRSFLA